MKTLLLALMFNLAAVLFFSTAFADSAHGIAAAGNGCPDGDIQVDIDQNDSSNLVIRYSDQMQAGADAKRRVERKSCNLRIPLEVPEGLRLTVEVGTIGFASVEGDRVYARQELFLAGDQGDAHERELQTGHFLLGVPAGQRVQTACGQSAMLALNLNSTVVKKSFQAMQDSFIGIDKTMLRFTWEQCGLDHDSSDLGTLGSKLAK